MATTVFSSAGTTQLRPDATTGVLAKLGRVYSLTVVSVGTAMTIDIYDHDSANTNKVLEYVTADGKVNWSFRGLVFQNGLRVVVGGTPGRFILEWD